MKIPSAGTPLAGGDLLSALSGLWKPLTHAFQDSLASRLSVRTVSLNNSGTTSCYLILKTLASQSSRREVVIPAYTAPSLTLPIRKAGLIPRLCDVSIDSLNLEPSALERVIGPQTLCVMPVHMFGLPCNMDEIRRRVRPYSIVIVEDAASSFGSRLNNRETGTLGDVGFFSFNRGKNLATLAGGCIVTENRDLFDQVEKEKQKLPPLNLISQFKLFVKLVGLAAAVRPTGYTLLYEFVKRYKYTTLHTDFESYQYPDVLAGAGVSLMRHADSLLDSRYRNGLTLTAALNDVNGIRLPVLPPNAYPVYNQFPLLVENPERRTRLVKEIVRKTGVEATTLYPEPLHRIYDMGYPDTPDPFPQATFMAKHLLLIPTHPLMTPNLLAQVAEVIRTEVG